MRYKCLKCESCCFDTPGDNARRIPLYPEEVDRLIKIAKKRETIKEQI